MNRWKCQLKAWEDNEILIFDFHRVELALSTAEQGGLKRFWGRSDCLKINTIFGTLHTDERIHVMKRTKIEINKQKNGLKLRGRGINLC